MSNIPNIFEKLVFDNSTSNISKNVFEYTYSLILISYSYIVTVWLKQLNIPRVFELRDEQLYKTSFDRICKNRFNYYNVPYNNSNNGVGKG